MSDPENKVDAKDAREASMSRVTTQDNLLESIASAQPASEAASDKKEETQENKEGTPKVKQSAQERITELAHKRREAVKEAEDARRENEELRARIKTLETAAPAVQQEDKPKRMNFASEDEYIEALTDWKAQKAIIDREQQQQQARLTAEEDERTAQYMRAVEDAKIRYPDFNEVLTNARIAIPQVVGLAIKESAIGGDVTYYLAKHQDEVKKLWDMSPIKAAKYIYQLERDLLEDSKSDVADKVKPEAKKRAPEPITPVKGTSVLPNSPARDFEEYRARRENELKARRKR